MFSDPIPERLRNSNHRIIITGASGWLGRATLALLHDALGSEFSERVLCFGSHGRDLEIAGMGPVKQHALDQLGGLSPAPSLLLHFAFLTKDRAEAMDEAAYRAANAGISRTVLESLDRISAEAAFVASSGAAAYADDPAASPAMRLYGALKREDEEAFAAWARRSGKRAVIGRIHNLSGPHINKLDSYALASFIVDALAGGPIKVRAAHDVVRGYVAIRELMSLALALLLDKTPGVVRFDSGGKPVELGELAAEVSAQLGGCTIERPDRSAGEDRYLGDNEVYQALLDTHAIETVPLAQQVAETIAYLSSSSSRRQ